MTCGFLTGRRKKERIITHNDKGSMIYSSNGVPKVFQTFNSFGGCHCPANVWCSYCIRWSRERIFWESIN